MSRLWSHRNCARRWLILKADMSSQKTPLSAASRTFYIETFGCQMNVHDSERVAGLLEEAGYQRAHGDVTPDLIVFNTCAVRENAADRLYGNLGHLFPLKSKTPGMQIAVGGCLAQMEREAIVRRGPWAAGGTRRRAGGPPVARHHVRPRRGRAPPPLP